MRLAFVTTRLFDEARSGGELCTARLAAALRAAGHTLMAIGRGGPADLGGAAAACVSLGDVVEPFDTLPAMRRVADALAALATGRAFTVHRLDAGDATRRVGEALIARTPTGGGFDALVVDHLQAYAWLAPLRERPPVLLVMHNLESHGYAERARRLGGDALASGLQRRLLRREATQLASLERAALSEAAAVACLSEDDARQLRRHAARCGSRAIIEALPGYPLHTAAARTTRDSSVRRVGMIGTWSWGPNRDALDWMLTQVVPRWPPTCTLVLAGTGFERRVLPPGVDCLGRVADAAELYEQVDVIAVASLHGSGVQEKAIEAAGSGRPLVATSHAVRGLELALLPQLHVSDDAAEFARLCVRVPTEPTTAHLALLHRWVESRRASHAAALARCLDALGRPGVGVPAQAARGVPA